MGKLAELVGKRIKEIRMQKGLRQEDMESLGISYKYYQKIERGKANVTLETIEKIAAALGRDPVEFFTFPLDKSPEMNQMAALTGEIIQRGDQEAAKKMNLFIKGILKYKIQKI